MPRAAIHLLLDLAGIGARARAANAVVEWIALVSKLDEFKDVVVSVSIAAQGAPGRACRAVTPTGPEMSFVDERLTFGTLDFGAELGRARASVRACVVHAHSSERGRAARAR